MARRGGSFRLLTLFGIRIGVDASWFVVLFLVIFALSSDFRDALDTSDGIAYLTAVVSALLFFGSIVLHELGHALAARRQGIETQAIDLWFFGGLARLSRDARTPGEEFKMAVAGPVVTLAIALLCYGLGALLVGSRDFLDAAGLRSRDISPGLLLLSWLGFINAGLLVFNLVPAYPLDGGRIARAVVWRLSGDRARATRTAARLGQLFAYLLGAIGILLLVRGAFDGLYLLVLGFLFGSSSRAAIVQSAVVERIEGVRVADIMDGEAVSVPSDLPLSQAREDFFDRYGWSWFPVVDAGGRLVGLLREPAARAGGLGPVAGAMEPGEPFRVSEDASLEDLVASEALRSLGGLVAVDADGRVRGIITLGRVRRALSSAVGMRAA